MKKLIKQLQQQIIPGFSGQAFSYGNKKLPKDVLIVNLSSATNCPSKALGLCKIAKVCYALHDEKQWPNCKNKNLAVEQWIQQATDQDIIKLLEAYIDAAPTKISHIRLDEAGDFVSQSQVNQWERIAEHLENTKGVKTYTYTCRSDLDFSGANHIVVNGSTPGVKGAVREFKCTPKDVYDTLTPSSGEYKCPGKCDKCHVCFDRKFEGIIYCRKH